MSLWRSIAFYQFDTNPRFPPFLLLLHVYVRCKHEAMFPFEPRPEKTGLRNSTRPHINQAVQPHKMARDLKFRLYCTIHVAICVFVFAYAKIWFSHDAAHYVKPLRIFAWTYAFEDKVYGGRKVTLLDRQ